MSRAGGDVLRTRLQVRPVEAPPGMWDLGLLDAWGSERKVVKTAGEADDGRNESPTATRHKRVRRMHGAVVRAAGLEGGGS